MTVTAAPTVSVIVFAASRAALLPRALSSIARAVEAMPEGSREIIVVAADGSGVDEVVARWDHPAQLVRVSPGPLGGLRAAGLAAARGAFVAYCDDGDEWAPDHLRSLLTALRAHPEAVLVYGDPLRRDGGASGGAEPSPNETADDLSNVLAGDVIHRASAAHDVGGFDPTLDRLADADLWLRIAEAHRVRHLPVGVTRHERRPNNVDPAERERFLRYHRRPRPWRAAAPPPRPPTPPFDPATWQAGRQLDWYSPLNAYQSFGLVGRQLLQAAVRHRVDARLAVAPPAGDLALAGFPRAEPGRGRIGFSYEYWHPARPLPVDLLVVATMREGTLVPPARINALNQTAALVYVPCRQNLESFGAGGLTAPLKVLPYGIDPLRFPRLERPRAAGAPFTFGTFGALSPRKGTDALVRAFRGEFAPHEPVRLLIKSVDDAGLGDPGDERIAVTAGFWEHADLLAFLARLDAFVLPSRAEGFGLCGLEAMATGLPTIVTDWSGPADYLDPADSLPLAYRLVEATGVEANGVRYFGQWAEPDEAHLRTLLRRLYDHPDQGRAMGQHASARVHAGWTWDHAAAQLRDDLDLLATGVSPV